MRHVGRGLLTLGTAGLLVAALVALTDTCAPAWIAWLALGVGALSVLVLLILGMCVVAARADRWREGQR